MVKSPQFYCGPCSPCPCDYSYSLLYNGAGANQSWNLMANPYPSYLNWNLLKKTNLSPTLYLWGNTISIGAPVTNTAHLRTYNSANGIGAPAGTKPYIAPMQGFFVKAVYSNPKLTFPTSARTYSMSTYYKDASVTEILVRLKIETDLGYDELVICKNPEAKPDFEEFDSEKMFDGQPIEIYSQSATGKNLVRKYRKLKSIHSPVLVNIKPEPSAAICLLHA